MGWAEGVPYQKGEASLVPTGLQTWLAASQCSCKKLLLTEHIVRGSLQGAALMSLASQQMEFYFCL